jgi:Tfp pilus assembly PilM family ATPase
VLDEGIHQLADAVRNSLNFYRMQHNAQPVGRAVLTGPAVGIPGFAESLSEALGMPVEPRIVAHGEDAAADASRLAVAAGLAVESV